MSCAATMHGHAAAAAAAATAWAAQTQQLCLPHVRLPLLCRQFVKRIHSFMASISDIPALVQRLRGSSRAAQLQAARSLAHLAFTEDEQEVAAAIIAVDGLPPLLQLLRSGSAAVQEEAARALNNSKVTLCTAPTAVVDAAQASGLDAAAIHLLLSGDSHPMGITAAVAIVAAMVQSSLSGHHSGAAGCAQLPDLLAAGVVHDMVALLSSAELLVQVAGLVPIAAVAAAPDGAAALLEAGSVDLLVLALSHDSIAVQRSACYALHNMAKHSTENSRIIAASGAATPMLALLSRCIIGADCNASSSSGGSGSSGSSKTYTSMAKFAVETLVKLCGASSAACSEGAAGGIPLLERAARLPDRELQATAAAMLQCYMQQVGGQARPAASWAVLCFA